MGRGAPEGTAELECGVPRSAPPRWSAGVDGRPRDEGGHSDQLPAARWRSPRSRWRAASWEPAHDRAPMRSALRPTLSRARQSPDAFDVRASDGGAPGEPSARRTPPAAASLCAAASVIRSPTMHAARAQCAQADLATADAPDVRSARIFPHSDSPERLRSVWRIARATSAWATSRAGSRRTPATRMSPAERPRQCSIGSPANSSSEATLAGNSTPASRSSS